MIKSVACFAMLLFLTTALAQNRFVGRWKTIDDETGKPISVVEIFESRGRIYGRIVELYNPKNTHRKCENCTGEDKNKPLLGLLVIKGLTRDGNEYSNGKILDPKQGKLYKCTISLDGNDRLKVRGFIGVSLIGRTQVWERLKG